MNILVPILVLGGFTALIVWIAVVGRRQERQRRVGMQAAATAMGFRYEEQSELWRELELPLFRQGHSQKASSVMTGETAGHPVTVMDYQYTIGHGKNRHTNVQTVTLFHTLGRGLPAFDLAPEHIFHKIGQVFGYQDIDFDSSEEFSKQYLLRGEDESAIRAAFGPTVLAFLTGEPGWSVQVRGEKLAAYRRGRCEPAQIPAFLADCLRIASNIGRA